MRNVYLMFGQVLGLSFALGLSLGMSACKKKPAHKGHDHSSHMHNGDPSHMHKGESNKDKTKKPGPDKYEPGKVNPKTGKVDIPAKGRGFKPALAKANVPDGAWICDMGTVHYARGEKGDGVCPICKMKLKRWVAAGAPKAADPMAKDHKDHMHAH